MPVVGLICHIAGTLLWVLSEWLFAYERVVAFIGEPTVKQFFIGLEVIFLIHIIGSRVFGLWHAYEHYRLLG